MSRKKIAVFLAQADENSQNLFMAGFTEKAFALDYDVCVFSMYFKYQETAQREIGDSNIYNLANLKRFDAIVILPDTILTSGLSEQLQEKIHREFDGPVIVVDKDSKYFPTVKIDHCEPIKKIINHIIEEHQAKDIVFVNGPEEHPHSIQRERGYRESLSAHGLLVSEKNIYYGNYWYDSGKEIAQRIIKDREYLPDAIACANDCMALGVAAELYKNGFRIPKDVIVVGYDSTEEGKRMPIALSSVDIPAYECGKYCADWISHALAGEEAPVFVPDAYIFIGESCGCKGHKENRVYDNKKNIWESQNVAGGYASGFNHMVEDMLAQYDYKSFFAVVYQYVYQIRDFEHFSICLNDYWNMPEVMNSDASLKKGYTKNMCRIISCGPSENSGNTIDFDNVFDLDDMIPELEEDRDRPNSFYFTPLFFNEKCFGYACISYADHYESYPEVYRGWINSVMHGMESFYRRAGLKVVLDRMKDEQVRDALTGLYNYKGFLNQGGNLCSTATNNGKYILVTAIDVKKLKDINARFGRKIGDLAILRLSQFINECASGNDLCSRMCNDEFIIASPVSENNFEYGEKFVEKLTTRIDRHNSESNESETHDVFELAICAGFQCDMVSNAEALDHLVNEAVMDMNRRKKLALGDVKDGAGLSERDKENDALTAQILDNNELTYHFQPIVNAKTGEIYAYEALMRSNTHTSISPIDILQSAERLERLHDVEKLTFSNVLDCVDANESDFAGKKIFINSITGCDLPREERSRIADRLSRHSGDVIIEFTEETEVDDNRLQDMKDNYERLNIETAIDDYGSGYSNVNNLLRYMPRYVKIDRMLMTDIHENPQKRHFVRDIIEFAHDNDILALAEGVETTQELKEVIKLGVDLIQGYYTSKPLPYIASSIPEDIVNEIIQYNQLAVSKYQKKEYVVKEEEKLSLVSLAMGKYTNVLLRKVTRKDGVFVLNGVSGFHSNLTLTIEDGYVGEIVLNMVSLSGVKGLPCIKIGENCDVKLRLVGDNELHTGGIIVPESSSLTFLGEGNLTLVLNSGKFYGIGNDWDSRHGQIVFDQDGGIIITANGMRGIGIGSGLGGDITIKRGHYELDLRGQDGVCIGAVDGETNLNISYSDIDIVSGLANNTIIGSKNKNAKIKIDNISCKIVGGGNNIVGIGTLYGEKCEVDIANANISLNIRAKVCYAIGSRDAETDISIQYATVKSVVQGKDAYAMGNTAKTAQISFRNSDVKTNVVNNTGIDIMAEEDNIFIENGRPEFIVNGAEIQRTIHVADF